MWKVILLAAFVTSAPSDIQDVIDFNPINEFTLKLLDNVHTYKEEFGEKNVALAPLSVWHLFSLLAEGSAGETFEELLRELRLPSDLRGTQNIHSSVLSVLKRRDQDVTLNSQSAMFADNKLNVHPEFCQSANYYGTDVYSVDVSNTTKLADDINYYVCVVTEGKIRDAVKPELLEDLRLILIDALYFKASWAYSFDPTETRQEAFYNSQGQTIGSVNMMHHKAPHNYGDSNILGARILEMTYGKREEYAMLLLVPFEGYTLNHLLGNLLTQSFDWMTEYKSGGARKVDVYVPRFKISSRTDLIRPLQFSGIQRIFDSNNAQLPGVSDSPLYVSKTVQNVDIEVTEEGTVAAASTVVGIENRILGPQFAANKEFVYLVVERQSNLILLAGVYEEPKLV